MQIKVSIVDDNEGIRSSLAALIRRAPTLKLLGEYPDAESAVKEIPTKVPDVVLMDINLPGMNGVECVRQLKIALPRRFLPALARFARRFGKSFPRAPVLVEAIDSPRAANRSTAQSS